MNEYNIKANTHHFARDQNNCDEHINSWIIVNISEAEIYRLNRNDYMSGITSMLNRGINQEQIEKYYPKSPKNNFGLQEVILEFNPNLANIVVYNSGTGSFLDIITRKDNKFKVISEYITQVYLCGVPNLLGIGISEIITIHLRSLSKKYANVVYVDPISSKFFYLPIRTEN